MSTQSENSLMKKTKKELCEIIFRKDDVEAKLRKELSDVNLDFSKAKDMIAKRDKAINDLNVIISDNNKQIDKLQDSIEELTAVNYDLTKKNRNTTMWCWIIAGIAVIGIVVAALI